MGVAHTHKVPEAEAPEAEAPEAEEVDITKKRRIPKMDAPL